MMEEWNVCPNLKTNFRCWLSNKGLWRISKEWGKWVFNIKPINDRNTAPTFGDQRNFFTGLFEAEWRNDNFVFKDGSSRTPQREQKIQMFKEILNEISDRAGIKDTKRGIDYYLHK